MDPTSHKVELNSSEPERAVKTDSPAVELNLVDVASATLKESPVEPAIV